MKIDSAAIQSRDAKMAVTEKAAADADLRSRSLSYGSCGYLVSVVIAAKDEAGTIADVISGCKPYAIEVIVVDGHSTDTTREICERAGVRVILDHGLGKGDAIRTAIPEISGDIAVFVDADGSHDYRDIPRLIEPIASGMMVFLSWRIELENTWVPDTKRPLPSSRQKEEYSERPTILVQEFTRIHSIPRVMPGRWNKSAAACSGLLMARRYSSSN